LQVLFPILGWNWPGAQFEHDDTADAIEYFPAAHSVHELAPLPLPVFVIEPVSQVVHGASELGSAEYMPAAHATHEIAPVADPVSVMDPAKHGRQYELSPLDWYFAASHAMHDAWFFNGWYSPESHVAQSPFFTYLPGIQSLQ
jgi:hypothetical protein